MKRVLSWSSCAAASSRRGNADRRQQYLQCSHGSERRRAPGVDVTLRRVSIGGGHRNNGTDGQGQFRFLNLDAGTYKVSTSLSGFNKMERNVIVARGERHARVPDGGEVSRGDRHGHREAPVVDVKKMRTLTTRPPWAAEHAAVEGSVGVLKTVPGVIVDRVNVGGNESGQHRPLSARAHRHRHDVELDGVVITDTTSGGASSRARLRRVRRGRGEHRR